MGKQKNVLLITVDQLSAAYIGGYGSREVMTPTLDSLAAGGILYDNFYSECPVCIPARRSLMTGLSPKTHGDRIYNDRLEMPKVTTLAEAFRQNGYQTYAVGKLHVYPQRNRIGFDDVILMEEGRYEFGGIDDYQIWLGEQGYTGQEFLHGMGSNTYYTRPWHLPEFTHPTEFVTREMMKQIKRKDPCRPAFYYASYQFPHPPLVPLEIYLHMYETMELEKPVKGDWENSREILKLLSESGRQYSDREIDRAKRAYYAQCTHIDYQIRLLIGTLRESGLLEDTIIVFTSDHGEMLFHHEMTGKRLFYEESARIPLIISGKPLEEAAGTVDKRLGVLADVMPTLLSLCNIPVPDSVEGHYLLGEKKRDFLYGEVGEGTKACRMVRKDQYKLIYYPWGNVIQLFDLKEDPDETRDLSEEVSLKPVVNELIDCLIKNLYGGDLDWIKDGELKGIPEGGLKKTWDYGLNNQRGYHWPPPSGYKNSGKNG